MDNLKVDVISQGFDNLKTALSLLDRSSVVGYKVGTHPVSKTPRMILYWCADYEAIKGAAALPFAMDLVGYANFVWSWLEQVEYPEKPRFDGSAHKGFHLYNECWGKIGDEGWGAFVAIEPEWALFGK